MDGWLKVYRKITEWEWYNHSEMVHLFLHLLIKASPTEKTWQGMNVQRGQVVVGRQKLSAETGISERTIRTCLSRLEKSGEIEIKTTNKYSLITICKYADYQPAEHQSDQQTDQQNDQLTDQPNDQPTDHIIRSKEDKNISSISPNVDIEFSARPKSSKGKEKKNDEPHEPGAKRKLKSGKDVSLFTRGQEVFMAYFHELYNEAYGWEAKDMVAIKSIFKKIEYNRKNRDNPLPIDDDSLLTAFGQFIRSINKAWIMNNFSLTKINSQYNEIIAEIRNRNRPSTSAGTTTQQQRGAEQLARQMSAVVNDIAKADEYYFRQRAEQGDSSTE